MRDMNLLGETTKKRYPHVFGFVSITGSLGSAPLDISRVVKLHIPTGT